MKIFECAKETFSARYQTFKLKKEKKKQVASSVG